MNINEQILKVDDCILYQSYISPQGMETLNKQRMAKGKKPMSLAGHLGYISKDDRVNGDIDYNSDINNDELANTISNEGYLTRQEAIINHSEFFKNEDKENFIVGCFNGEVVRKKEKDKKLQPFIQHLNQLEENGKYNVQSSVISFPPDISKQIKGMIDQEEFLSKINKCYETHLQELGYNKDNINVIICAHTNKDHFHLHIDVWEKSLDIRKNRKMHEWDVEVLKQIRKDACLILNDQINGVNKVLGAERKNLLNLIGQNIQIPEELVRKIDNQNMKVWGRIEDSDLKNEIYNYAEHIFKTAGFYKNAVDQYEYDKLIKGEEVAKNQAGTKYVRSCKDIANKIIKHIKNPDGDLMSNEELLQKINLNNSFQKQVTDAMLKDYQPQKKKMKVVKITAQEKIKKKCNGNFLKIDALWSRNIFNHRVNLLNSFIHGFKKGYREEKQKYAIKRQQKENA